MSKSRATEETLPPLSKKAQAELRRRVADSDDPTRYVIVSAFARKFCLYYTPTSGDYRMNEIPPEAMFKRKAEAKAVMEVLERGRRKRAKKSLQVMAVRAVEGKVQILEKIADPWQKGKFWKPVLRKD